MNESEKTFQRIVEHLDIDVSVNPEHQRDLRRRMLAVYADTSTSSPRGSQPLWSRLVKSNITRIAAAAMIVLGIFLFLTQDNGTELAWGDVVEQIKDFRPYACTRTIYEGDRSRSVRLLRLNLSQRREERDNGDIDIFDLRRCPVRTLALNEARRYARLSLHYGIGPATDPDHLLTASTVKETDAQRLGTAKIDGVRTQGFRMRDAVNDISIWADAASGVPVKVQVVHVQDGDRTVYEEFEFGRNFDAALFATVPPEDYYVDRQVRGVDRFLAEGHVETLTPADQLQLARAVFEMKNADGLGVLFDGAAAETKLAVVNYLSAMGTEAALAVLESLDVSQADAAVREAVQAGIAALKPEQTVSDDGVSQKPDETEVTTPSETADAPGTETGQPDQTAGTAAAQAGRLLQITVTDRQTGQPIENALIRSAVKRLTDQNGYAEMPWDTEEHTVNLPVWVGKDGYVQMCYSVRRENSPGDGPIEIRFAMEKATAIGGIVEDSDGNRLADIEVTVRVNDDEHRDRPENNVRHTLTTDENGFWEFDGVPARLEQVNLRAAPVGYAETSVWLDTPEAISRLREKTYVLAVDQGYSLSGTVTDEAGTPIAGARVQLGEHYLIKDRQHQTHTDDQGRYSFQYLKVGSASITYENVPGEGKVPVRRPFDYLTVTAEGFAPSMMQLYFTDKQMQLNFVLVPGSPLYGRVVDPEGEPLAEVTVRADNWGPRSYDHIRSIEWMTRTDQDGRFVWAHAPEQPVQLKLTKDGYMDLETAHVAPSDTEHEFVLNPKVRVAAQVIDAVTQQPVTVFTFRRHEGGYISTPQKVQNAEGRFTTAFDDQGTTFTIAVEADGYRPTRSRAISLIEQDVDLVIKMTPDAGLDGVLVDANGEPVEGVRVMIPGSWLTIDNLQVRAGQLADVPNTITDAQGRFHLDPVGRDVYQLLAVEQTGYLFIPSTDFPEDGVFILQPYAKIVGDYYKGSQPAANELIRIDYPNYRNIRKGEGVIQLGVPFNFDTQTDATGRFVFDKLIAGTARILIDPYRQVELAPGETVEVCMGGDGPTVTGQVLTPAGEGLNADYGYATLRMQRLYEDLPFPEEELPLPEDVDALSYSGLLQWFEEYVNSSEGQAWAAAMEQKYGDFSEHRSFKVVGNGRFEVPNVRPGRYLLTVEVRPWQDPALSPRKADYSRYIARGSAVFTVPETATGEQMDVPVDLGTVLCRRSPLTAGDAAPDFDIKNLKAPGRIRLGDYRGKTVLINFTNPAMAELEPEPAAMLAAVCELAHNQAAIVNVVMEMVPWDTMRRKMIPACTLPGVYGTAQIHTSKIYVDYEVGSLPMSVLVGPNGTVLWTGTPNEELLDVLDR